MINLAPWIRPPGVPGVDHPHQGFNWVVPMQPVAVAEMARAVADEVERGRAPATS
jgi:hypothetical protein